jgi:hypothetical protein
VNLQQFRFLREAARYKFNLTGCSGRTQSHTIRDGFARPRYRAMTCTICNDSGWLCELHEHEPFPCQFCELGGTAMPCHACAMMRFDRQQALAMRLWRTRFSH